MDTLAAMLNIFIDPKASVDRFAGKKWAWVGPVVFMGIVMAVIGVLVAPITVQVMLSNPPEGMSYEQVRRSAGMIETVSKVTAFLSPGMLAAILAICAAVLLGSCTVSGVSAKFGDLFNLLAHCSLVGFVQHIAGAVVVFMKKDDLNSMAELQPSFGLDLLLPEGSSKLLHGLLGYFSVFNLWYIVILGLAFAHLTRTPRGKAFAVTAPVWIIGMIFFVLGALFRPA